MTSQSATQHNPAHSPTQHNGTDRAESLAWTSLGYFVTAWLPALGVTIVCSALFAGLAHGLGAFFAVLGVSIAIATGSGTVGWLFGLLFGIPRSLARANVLQTAAVQSTAPAAAAAQSTVPPAAAAQSTAPAAAAAQSTAPAAAAAQSTAPAATAAQSTAPAAAAAQSTVPPAAAAQSTAPAAAAAQSTAPPAAVAQSTAPPAAATQSAPPPTGTVSSAKSVAPRSTINTNLEDISDWLTKTIIGVGLTQLYSIPHTTWAYATKLDQATLQGQGGGAVLILSLTVAAAAGAFWIGYVTTRTILTKLFDMF